MQHGQKIVTLNVGGRRFVTTAATLSSVEGSFLWKLVTAQQQSAAAPRASLSGEFFIDRNGKVRWACSLSLLLELREHLACYVTGGSTLSSCKNGHCGQMPVRKDLCLCLHVCLVLMAKLLHCFEQGS